MSDPQFFGYGSLVNVATHQYPAPRPATLRDWRRVWVPTRLRDVAFLSIAPAPGHQIDGLLANVPDADWSALDLRETGYNRTDVMAQIDPPTQTQTAAYFVPDDMSVQASGHVILRSYLETVIEGFHAVFGAQGVTRFFDTTDGWSIAIRDDRASPVYPRATNPGTEIGALVDQHLERVKG